MGPGKDQGHAFYVLDPPERFSVVPYALAMAFVAAVFGSVAFELGQTPMSDTAAETQDAVMVDLPPVEAGSHPQGEDAPPQEAAPASAGAQSPQPTPSPPDESTPQNPPAPVEENVPQAPAPATILPPPPPPLPQQQAPASAPREAHQAGALAQAPAKADANDADEMETHRNSAHLITLWQKALMGRLQAARHHLTAGPATGVARNAFSIDRGGRLLSAHVARGSGSAAVDAAALSLVQRAAPFPVPPAGAGDMELTFIVPISFKH